MFESLATDLIYLKEDTSMSSISYLPSHLGTVKAAIASLAKQMPEWNIEILEDFDSKKVQFGESLCISVPNEHWEEFLSLFDNCDITNHKINLSSELNEAMEYEISDLLKNLKPQLIRTFSVAPFDEVQLDINRWRNRFGADKFKAQDVLVSYQNKKNDLRELYNGLLKYYKNDKGNLEMLIDALKGKTSLASFQLFNDRKFLYGARVFSRFHGIKMLFEGIVNPEFNMSESVYINDPDVLDVLEEQPRGYKVVGNVVYPKGQRFAETFYKILEGAI